MTLSLKARAAALAASLTMTYATVHLLAEYALPRTPAPQLALRMPGACATVTPPVSGTLRARCIKPPMARAGA